MDRVIGPASRSILSCFPLLALLACGSGSQGEPLGQEGAHEHGVADVSIVVEGREATVLFQAPAGDLFGSGGGEPNEAQRERARASLRRVEANLVAMLGLPAELECRVTEVFWAEAAEGVLVDDGAGTAGREESDGRHEDEHGHDHDEQPGHDHEDGRGEGEPAGEHAHEHEQGEAGHSDVVGDFRISCASSLEGTTLTLVFTDHLEGIEKIDLQAVSGERQFGRRVPASGSRVRL